DTSLLNQELREGINEQIDLLRHQFDQLDPTFPDKFGSTNYRLSEKQIRYLKLDLGEQERLTVEQIRSLQAELGVQSQHAFEWLRNKNRAQATFRLTSVEGLEKEIDEQFSALSVLQTTKLEAVQEQLNNSVAAAYAAIGALAGALILTLMIFTLLLRRRVLQPLRSILEAADQMRQGNFEGRAVAERADEIGQLAMRFNFMAESLADSYRGLEQKVEERTRELQALQLQLVQAEKMSAVGLLVSGVAHELNNPLAVIMGYTELAKMRLNAANGDPRQIKMLEDLHFQADRCRKIVANLLQFSRGLTPHLEVVCINDVVEQVLQLREYEMNTRNISLVREYDSANPYLCADMNKIQQVVLNLLNNAFDAIQEAGRPGEIRVRTTSSNGAVTLEFIDNGAGILEPERVFEPFYTTKEAGRGSGLGLSVCYGIVEEHSGEISAQNLSEGARFVVTLPIGDLNAAVRGQETSEEVRFFRDYSALVVDDEEQFLRLQTAYLASLGMKTTGAHSGEEAVGCIEAGSFDIVIADVRMPGSMDGLQLYDWCLARRPDLAKRFLFVSGDLIALNTGQLFSDRSVARIQKPFKFEEYARAIRGVLES
ncbi:MAG TPA: hybrid sensor histidine kinase/response regulator, partial [Blastocatellia bacterium]|nr:hybrid sensor histidine kinase/response regulator [Blastocatellia bacterium]